MTVAVAGAARRADGRWVAGDVERSGGGGRQGGGGTTDQPVPPGAGRPPATTIYAVDMATGRRTILLVEDEPAIAEPLSESLAREGFDVEVAGTVSGALDATARMRPDLMLLDLMLPDGSGFDVCRAVRRDSDVPIIMLTARGDEADRVVGLELGADDYVVKPFSAREVVARVRAVLRRTAAAAPRSDGERDRPLEVDDVRLDPSTRTVTRSGTPVAAAARRRSHRARLRRRRHLRRARGQAGRPAHATRPGPRPDTRRPRPRRPQRRRGARGGHAARRSRRRSRRTRRPHRRPLGRRGGAAPRHRPDGHRHRRRRGPPALRPARRRALLGQKVTPVLEDLALGDLPTPAIAGALLKKVPGLAKVLSGWAGSAKEAAQAHARTLRDGAARRNLVLRRRRQNSNSARRSPGAAEAPLKETRTGLRFTGHGVAQLAKRRVRTPDALDAYRNPLQRGPIRIDEQGRPGQRLIGRDATIVLSPETKQIVTGYPTSTRIRDRLLRQVGDGE